MTLLNENSTPNEPDFDYLGGTRVEWIKNLARREQLEPEGEWTTWLYLAGRGAGKTRSCAEWLAWKVCERPNVRTGIIARTYADARDTCAEGESGILSVLRQYKMLDNYNRSIGEITLKNKSRIKLFSAEEPDRLRGPQHEFIWADELAAWQYEDTWDMAQFGLRLGQAPQIAIATTPRPTPLLRRIIADKNTVITRGTTYDNLKNLAPTVQTAILARYEGTRLGRQELFGEMLDDVPGALWTMSLIDDNRVAEAPQMTRIVVAIDPAVTSGENADETGIVVVGRGEDGDAYVLADRTIRDTPNAWANKAIAAFREFGEIGTIVGEKNQGGDLIENVLRSVDPHIPYKGITAKQGKRLRAEPISALYEQGRVHHVGVLTALEDQLCGWVPDSGLSPDRLDALVHGIAELNLARGSSADRWLAEIAPPCIVCSHPMNPSEAICNNCGAHRKERA